MTAWLMRRLFRKKASQAINTIKLSWKGFRLLLRKHAPDRFRVAVWDYQYSVVDWWGFGEVVSTAPAMKPAQSIAWLRNLNWREGSDL